MVNYRGESRELALPPLGPYPGGTQPGGTQPVRTSAPPASDDELFTESTPLAPRSPYSATKASADLLALAYHRTHGLDVVVTRCSNNYGPYQFPEKLIPLMVCNAMKGEPLPVYGDGLNVRDWIHVQDHCRGLDAVLRKGRSGEVYNFGGARRSAPTFRS